MTCKAIRWIAIYSRTGGSMYNNSKLLLMSIYTKIIQLEKSKKPAVLITVISAKGSVPREAGAKMVVEQNGFVHGTIGGGAVEKMVIDEALQTLKTGKAHTVKHDLDDKQGADTGMVCGGNMEFFLEPLQSSGQLYIFGGGHIALHLSHLADMMEWSYTVIDDREEFCNEKRFPNADELFAQNPDIFAEALLLSEKDFVVVITRGHEHDYEIIRQVLSKPSAYLGMIGSKVKRREIYQRLQKNDGYTEQDLKKIHSPIGLDIGAKTPQEIALSIMAELIKIKNELPISNYK